MDVNNGVIARPVKAERAKSMLSWVALFLGELRDGLTMINMQSLFLITSLNYSEKQAGLMFFVFGMAQFVCQTPAGYLMDYTNRKTFLLGLASVATTSITILTALFAQEEGKNLTFMLFLKLLQGMVASIIPPGLNSITQGIVGSVGMTEQVSKNEMMNHMGTAAIVLTGSILAYWLYPDIGMLFIISPVFCVGVVYFLSKIKPGDIDHDAARGLVLSSDTTTSVESFDGESVASGRSYTPPNINNKSKEISTMPSFRFGLGQQNTTADDSLDLKAKADTPLKILRDPILVTFIVICFSFHLANGTVLPLVMQKIAMDNGKSGIFLSGSCIIVSQIFSVISAKICGDYSGIYGRKLLFLIGLGSLPIRCFLVKFLLTIRDDDNAGVVNFFILSTQCLDGIGAGLFLTLYVLVTSDISGGTGRFSLTLGLTTSAMSIGGTISGYLGQALAYDYGYEQAFVILGLASTFPLVVYLLCMPETLSSNSTVSTSIHPMPSISEGENYCDIDEKIQPKSSGISTNEVI